MFRFANSLQNRNKSEGEALEELDTGLAIVPTFQLSLVAFRGTAAQIPKGPKGAFPIDRNTKIEPFKTGDRTTVT